MPGDAAWEALASRDWPRALQAALAAIAGEGLTASP